MIIQVRKLTDVDLLHEFAAASTRKDCYMSLATAYRNMHSIIRTQLFVVRMENIPQFVASQLVRQTQGVTWVMQSKRPDRGGEDFRRVCDMIAREIRGDEQDQRFAWQEVLDLPGQFDRCAPTDLIGLLNAEALINMAHKRLCSKASEETRNVVNQIREQVRKVDPNLADHMVPQCIYRGGICPENNPCGVNRDKKLINEYKQHYQ